MSCITAAAGTELAHPYSSNTVKYSSLRKGVYNSKTFILHAVLLHQTLVHCAIFPTAASRRSLFRISVPVWLTILSNQLLIIALVSHYPTNKLIKCKLMFRRVKLFNLTSIMGYYQTFPNVIPHLNVDSHTLLTRPPRHKDKLYTVKLACVKHTASVHPEPGSNSSF